MIDAIFRVLENWPRTETPADDRKRYPFQSGYQSSLDMLEKELHSLDASSIIIQIETEGSQIRNDGWPRSDVRTTGPKVAVTFSSKHGPLSYYCDACRDWKDNIRAIALTLKRLRLADLYGVTSRGEQYSGFKSLPAGPTVDQVMTIDAAAATLCELANESPAKYTPAVNRAEMDLLYKRAAMNCHHDIVGAEQSLSWKRLQAAYAVLKKIYGRA